MGMMFAAGNVHMELDQQQPKSTEKKRRENETEKYK